MTNAANQLNQYLTTALIPSGGVYMTPTAFPQGYFVALYDDEGFTSLNRWFATFEQAQTYARKIEREGA